MKCLENNFLCIRVTAACGTAWMRGEQRSYLDLWWRLRWHLRQTNVFFWSLIDTNYDVKTCEVVILMTFIRLPRSHIWSRSRPQAASRCHVCLRRRYLWADDTLSEILGDTVTSARHSRASNECSRRFHSQSRRRPLLVPSLGWKCLIARLRMVKYMNFFWDRKKLFLTH